MTCDKGDYAYCLSWLRRNSGRRGWPHQLAVFQDDRSSDHFILEIDVKVILLTDRQQEFRDVVGVQRRSLRRQAAREIGQTDVDDILEIGD